MKLNLTHIVGHRGARGEAPENTLGGFEYLRNLGIQRVELDVHLSKDHKLMVIHDDSTLRTSLHENLLINDTECEQLTSINVASIFQHWSTPEPIATLDTVLGNWPHLQDIQIEVKPLPSAEMALIMAMALKTLLVLHFPDNIGATLTSSDQRFLSISKSINDCDHGLVADESVLDPVATAIALGCNLLALNHKLYTPAIQNQANAHKLPISLWTVNNPHEAAKYIEQGAQSIITDYPGGFIRWIETEQMLDNSPYKTLPSIHWADRTKGIAIDTLVIHSMYFEGTEELPQTPENQLEPMACKTKLDECGVSAHFMIDPMGEIYQLVPINKKAWHAGKSQLPFSDDARDSINDFSIGIELLYHETNSPTPLQYMHLQLLIDRLRNQLPITTLVGHQDIAPDRKTDPWNFDWQALKLGGLRTSLS